jgi:D-alanine transaminase
MGSYVWNGEQIIERGSAATDVEDRGYNFGDGVYEVFRIYSGKIFAEMLHWTRLERSIEQIHMKMPLPIHAFQRGINELMRADDIDTGIIYLQVTRGVAPRAHVFPSSEVRPVIMALTKPMARPITDLERGVAVITQPDLRWLRCDIKSLNLLPNVLAKQAAAEAGAVEAILHRNGIVTEGSSSNVAIVRDGMIVTHPANELILHGITRAVVCGLAHQLGIPLMEKGYSVEELCDADEAFLMSTTSEVMPIVQCDGRPLGSGVPGPITRRLQRSFLANFVN